jgi:hypothetical protein
MTESPTHQLYSGKRFANRVSVDLAAEKRQDRMDPSRTVETVSQGALAEQTESARKGASITAPPPVERARPALDDARRALDLIDPQMVIDSILSREWSNFDPQARWRKGKRQLLDGLGALPQDGVTKPYAEAELYRQINNKLAAPPGAVAGRISLEYLQSGNEQTFQEICKTVQEIRKAVNEGQVATFLDQVRDKDAWFWSWLSKRKDLAPGDLLEKMNSIVPDEWAVDVTKMIRSQQRFTELRDQLEQYINELSPVLIMGMQGVRAAYAKIDPNLPVPDARRFIRVGEELLATMGKIEGEPSIDDNLDPVAQARDQRLKDILATLNAERDEEKEMNNADSDDSKLLKALTHATEVGEIMSLAREKSQVQYEALLIKLSRAFQKPDFCLRRDAFSTADRNQFFPLALSWDEDWYFGEDRGPNPDCTRSVPGTTEGKVPPGQEGAVTMLPGSGERQSHPEGSPPAGEF